uniref:Type III effector n=1 Tax=Panagrellus redivivus TaxID=6233 RepID=A0A7E4VX41_PANRE
MDSTSVASKFLQGPAPDSVGIQEAMRETQSAEQPYYSEDLMRKARDADSSRLIRQGLNGRKVSSTPFNGDDRQMTDRAADTFYLTC